MPPILSSPRQSLPVPCGDGRGMPEPPVPAELLAAIHARVAATPDLRHGTVEAARARLAVEGPPSAEQLADMLLDHLRPHRPLRRRPRRGVATGHRYA